MINGDSGMSDFIYIYFIKLCKKYFCVLFFDGMDVEEPKFIMEIK